MKAQACGGCMSSVNRLSTLRIASAFLTVSTNAYVVAGMPPLDLLARERQQKYAGAEVAKEDQLLSHWQRRWDALQKDLWTHRLIPKIKEWLARRHGEVDYYLTQFLTNHRCFKACLLKFKHAEDILPELSGIIGRRKTCVLSLPAL
ncbi:uncharacterized protein LOC126851885 [Cataglyphis hispanica]|uniref:uncharacterized protein LOC126851885 n=1 Tax=Cataglyphis hispanica TaxID=1086592 RepID=UPI00217F8780|nr:uncharacterized protein LOC126851885 [Cataglyphis hispanica]